MAQHKDQERVQKVLFPVLMDRALDETPEAQRDCTVLNRFLVQGPDPLFIMESCPDEFVTLCDALGVTVEEGRKAIEDAHWTGPGCLLPDGGKGLPGDLTPTSHMNVSVPWRLEALWLILASMSDCTEEGYTEDTTLLTRMQKAIRATNAFARFTTDCDFVKAILLATEAVDEFIASTEYEEDENGVPHGYVDHAFYVLYKLGYKAAAVHTEGPTFWGTTPDTTLEEQGITVDKPLSPHFGLTFPAPE